MVYWLLNDHKYKEYHMSKRRLRIILGTVTCLVLGCLLAYQPAQAQDATPTPQVTERQVFEVLPLSAEVNQYCEQIIGQRTGLFTLFPGSISKLFGSLMQTGHRELVAITPPPGLEEMHGTLASGLEDCAVAAEFLEIGIVNLGAAEARLALELINSCAEKIADATDQMLAHGTSDDVTNESGAVASLSVEETPTPAPTITPTPSPTPTFAPCTCTGNLYNCTDFTTTAEAQACFNLCQTTIGVDIHRLDFNSDGLACNE